MKASLRHSMSRGIGVLPVLLLSTVNGITVQMVHRGVLLGDFSYRVSSGSGPKVLSRDGSVALMELRIPDANWNEEFYNLAAGHKLCTAPPVVGSIAAADLSPDGRLAVAGSSRGDLEVFDVQQCRSIWRHLHAADGIFAAAISPNGKLLAVVTVQYGRSYDSFVNSIEVFDLASGQRLHNLGAIPGHIEMLAFSPDSRLLVAATHSITLFDVFGGTRLTTFAKSKSDVVSLGFGTGRYQLYVVRAREGLTWWDAMPGHHASESFHTAAVTAAWSAPDGTELAELNSKRDLLVFRGGNHRAPFKRLRSIRILRAQFLTDERLALVSEDLLRVLKLG